MTKTTLFISFTISILLVSCGGKKQHKEHESIDEAPAEQQQILQKASRSQTEDPTDPLPNHEYLNGHDITNNKRTCSTCQGTGKLDGADCSECQGYGYILVYK